MTHFTESPDTAEHHLEGLTKTTTGLLFSIDDDEVKDRHGRQWGVSFPSRDAWFLTFIGVVQKTQTCRVDNSFSTNYSMRGLDIPAAIGPRAKGAHWSWTVDLSAVHPSSSSQSHRQGVRVNMSIPRGVQACQHLNMCTKHQRI